MALVSLALGGCGSVMSSAVPDAAGIGAGAAAASVTSSAAVVTGVTLGVRGLASAGVDYAERRLHHEKQEVIARAAGPLAPDMTARWISVPFLPGQRESRGEVVVSRLLGSSSFACKEIVFSEESGPADALQRAFYTATVCRDGEDWRWASAEPATERWGGLQ